MSVDVQRVRRADTAELIAANRDNTAYHAPWVTPFTDQAGFDAWFGRGVTGANMSLLARERGSGALVGVINLSEIVLGVFRSAYLGYWGYAATGGRGLMTHALRAAVGFAFDELGLHRVEANVQPDNARSIALVRRAGFSREGFSPGYLFIDGAWRDHERWALRAGAP
ncbi:MAG TPA: GNAT family protein [Candidatus Elarobacter sp.]|nr:GNAT family protein [Candidatus Elarobacter sp.]